MYANRQLYNFYHLGTTSAGALIIAGSGVLHTINVNTPVAGQVITIADATTGTSGKTIAAITCVATTAPVAPYIYDVAYATGLWIINTTGAADITVAYK